MCTTSCVHLRHSTSAIRGVCRVRAHALILRIQTLFFHDVATSSQVVLINVDTEICGRCQRSLVHCDVHLLPTQWGAALTAVCPACWLVAQVRALLEASLSRSSEYSTALDGLSAIHSVLRSSAEERYREELSLLRLLRAEARGQPKFSGPKLPRRCTRISI